MSCGGDYNKFMGEFNAMLDCVKSRVIRQQDRRFKFRANNILSRKEERKKHYEAIADDCVTKIMSRYEALVATKKERACKVEEEKMPTYPIPLTIQDHDKELPPIESFKEEVGTLPLEELPMGEHNGISFEASLEECVDDAIVDSFHDNVMVDTIEDSCDANIEMSTKECSEANHGEIEAPSWEEPIETDLPPLEASTGSYMPLKEESNGDKSVLSLIGDHGVDIEESMQGCIDIEESTPCDVKDYALEIIPYSLSNLSYDSRTNRFEEEEYDMNPVTPNSIVQVLSEFSFYLVVEKDSKGLYYDKSTWKSCIQTTMNWYSKFCSKFRGRLLLVGCTLKKHFEAGVEASSNQLSVF